MKKSLYEAFHLNFTSTLPRTMLDEFASQVARDGTGSLVVSVWDQYLDYVVLEPCLFSLLPGPPRPATQLVPSAPAGNGAAKQRDWTTYERLNDTSAGEREVEAETDRIAQGLFSTLATMGECGYSGLLRAASRAASTNQPLPGTLPIIRCPRGNAAELVGRKLEGRLREHISSARGSAHLFSGESAGSAWGSSRPCERWSDLEPARSDADARASQCSSFSTATSTLFRCCRTRGRTRRSCTTCST